jgi:hypothetical protein
MSAKLPTSQQSESTPLLSTGNTGLMVKPERVKQDTRREIDRLARQTEGISKALRRLKEAV